MKFSIRDLLWLTLVVGLSGGWWVDHTSLTTQAELTRVAAFELVEGVSRDRRISSLEEENQQLRILIQAQEAMLRSPTKGRP